MWCPEINGRGKIIERKNTESFKSSLECMQAEIGWWRWPMSPSTDRGKKLSHLNTYMYSYMLGQHKTISSVHEYITRKWFSRTSYVQLHPEKINANPVSASASHALFASLSDREKSNKKKKVGTNISRVQSEFSLLPLENKWGRLNTYFSLSSSCNRQICWQAPGIYIYIHTHSPQKLIMVRERGRSRHGSVRWVLRRGWIN